MKKLWLLLGLLAPVVGYSQSRSEDERFYNADEHVLIDKFEREHIPLDGKAVQYIPFRKDEKYGFVDKQTHQQKIAPTYEQVFAVYPEGAIVSPDGDDYGLVDYNGKFLIQPAFRNLYKEGNLYHGLISASDTSRKEPYRSYTANFYFNEKGQFVFEADAHSQESFSDIDALAWFRHGRTYTIYNREGKQVKTFQWDSTRSFQGIFGTSLIFKEPGTGGNVFAAYTADNRLLYRLPLDENYVRELYKLNDTLFGLVNSDGFLFVNDKGEPYDYGVVFDAVGFGFENEFDGYYGAGPLLVRDDEGRKYGYMNKQGKFLVPMEYRYLGRPGDNGWVAFLKPAAMGIGFADTTGVVKIAGGVDAFGLQYMAGFGLEPQFHEGLCVIAGQKSDTLYGDGEDEYRNYRWYYINESGKEALALPDNVTMAGHFSGGLAPVLFTDKSLGFIDKHGKVKIPGKYSLAVAGAYPLPVIIWPYFRNGFAYIKAWKGYIDANGYEFFSGKRVYDHYNFSH